ncbi:MAG: hypothetical protein KGZ25_15525, partial [Planctomycetes bacterium]|nr:hypothetical protein [Planctomycetota bacterium]
MDSVKIDDAEVSRFILGSNPFSGFSHQSPEIDSQMKHYYTSTRIKETLADAESCGITTLIARADHHMIRVLMEYWDEGGDIQWFAQTCPEVGSQPQCIARAIANNAKAVYIHGGYVDNLLANDRIEEVKELIDQVHQHDIPAGMAGHNPDVFRWAEKEKLPVDYYMCSYYNSAHRDKRAEHVPGQKEWFLEEDRRIMS